VDYSPSVYEHVVPGDVSKRETMSFKNKIENDLVVP
jgi:hypothetical protein